MIKLISCLKRPIAVIVTVLLFFMFFGCATARPIQRVALSTSPSGAKITINGDFCAFTPAFTSLFREKDYEVTFALDGYEPYSLSIKHRIDYVGWVVGNIFFGGLIGLAIDAATGKYYRLSSDDISVHGERINVTLKPNVKKDK